MSSKKNEEKIYDLRTLDNQISRGNVKPADYDKYLKSLPDDEGNYQLVQIEDDASEEADEE